jgi:hypothetical protein
MAPQDTYVYGHSRTHVEFGSNSIFAAASGAEGTGTKVLSPHGSCAKVLSTGGPCTTAEAARRDR